jgi:LPS sulfotransferase NodH
MTTLESEPDYTLGAFAMALRYSASELKEEYRRYGRFFSDLTNGCHVPRYEGVTKYVLASSARVGGHWLGQILHGLGCGQPEEFLSDYHLTQYVGSKSGHKPIGLGISDYWQMLFTAAVEKSLGRATVGIKVNLLNLLPLLENNAFPFGLRNWKWVYLYREDVIEQAISLYVARTTDSWNSFQGQDRISNLKEADCDLQAVIDQIHYICAERSRWDLFFSAFRIDALRISYENLQRDVLEQAVLVRRHLELQNSDLAFRSFAPLKKQKAPIYLRLRERVEEAIGIRPDQLVQPAYKDILMP